METGRELAPALAQAARKEKGVGELLPVFAHLEHTTANLGKDHLQEVVREEQRVRRSTEKLAEPQEILLPGRGIAINAPQWRKVGSWRISGLCVLHQDEAGYGIAVELHEHRAIHQRPRTSFPGKSPFQGSSGIDIRQDTDLTLLHLTQELTQEGHYASPPIYLKNPRFRTRLEGPKHQHYGWRQRFLDFLEITWLDRLEEVG